MSFLSPQPAPTAAAGPIAAAAEPAPTAGAKPQGTPAGKKPKPGQMGATFLGGDTVPGPASGNMGGKTLLGE